MFFFRLVRSRSALAPCSRRGRLFLASTAAVAYAVTVGGAGAADQAFDGFCFAVVWIIANELFFGPVSGCRRSNGD